MSVQAGEPARANRPLIFAGGLCGTLGVALSAAAAHMGGAFTGTVANFLLFHAATLLAIGLGRGNRVLRIGGYVVLAGLAIFCADLLTRDYLGGRILPMAAPVGGMLLILGWLMIAASAFTDRT